MKLGRKRQAVFFERSRTQTGKMGGAGAAENQEKTGKKIDKRKFPLICAFHRPAWVCSQNAKPQCRAALDR